MRYAYKFLRTNDLDFIIKDETLMLGTYRKYRQMEEADGIGDKFEGRNERFVKSFSSSDHKEQRDMISKIPPLIDISADWEIGELVLQDVYVESIYPNALILSLSREEAEFGELTERMCHQDPGFYDACVKMQLIEVFLALRKVGILPDGRRLGAVTESYIDFVAYGDVSGDATRSDLLSPGPFSKSANFAYQHEVRMLFQFHERFEPTEAIIHVPGLSDLVEIAFKDRKPS